MLKGNAWSVYILHRNPTVSRFGTVAQIKVKHVFDSKKCVSFVLELSKSFLFDLLFAFLQQTDV